MLLAAVALFAAAAPERWKSLIDERRILPAEHPAIDYWNAEPTDPVARLQEKLIAGEAALELARVALVEGDVAAARNRLVALRLIVDDQHPELGLHLVLV